MKLGVVRNIANLLICHFANSGNGKFGKCRDWESANSGIQIKLIKTVLEKLQVLSEN